jgi:hypothetical protein
MERSLTLLATSRPSGGRSSMLKKREKGVGPDRESDCTINVQVGQPSAVASDRLSLASFAMALLNKRLYHLASPSLPLFSLVIAFCLSEPVTRTLTSQIKHTLREGDQNVGI